MKKYKVFECMTWELEKELNKKKYDNYEIVNIIKDNISVHVVMKLKEVAF